MSQQPPEQPHARLFIAILVPDEVKGRIFAAQEKLKASARQDLVRWTDRHQFHLTLRFLGNVKTEEIPRLIEATTEACSKREALRMAAQTVGFFPNASRPRVLWVGIADEGQQLSPVQQDIQAATLEFTSEPPQKEFTGHVTLGRFKTFDRQAVRELVSTAKVMQAASFGGWGCREVHLIQSRLSPHGAEHTSIASFKLRS